MNSFPEKGMEISHILVSKDLKKSKEFYINILGAELFREYGGTTLVLKLLNNWFVIVTEGEPTIDKPGIHFKSNDQSKEVNHSFTFRVENCQRSYEVLKSRGAEFITPPYDHGHEIRCFFKDPDGNLFEISEIPQVS